ncbi:MAG: heavy-metal-associated domain-containing protein [Bacteroidaceae bacterium]|nr:heavy-metal-associated domain-containing protein [Bacteroidaceae bacterium]
MNKRVFSFVVAFAAAITLCAKDIKTLVVTTQPQMHCENCEKKIKGNLRFEKGVKKIETDVERQRVTIIYDADKAKADDLIKAFDKFGYKARKVAENK